MQRSKLTLRIFFVLVGLDLLALLVGAAMADLYLRPLTLLALLVHGFMILPRPIRVGRLLILIGLAAAVLVEAVQRLDVAFGIVVAGTAVYYLFYTLGFALNKDGAYTWKSLLAFPLVAIYMVLMFLWLNPYGFTREPAMVYVLVATIMTGFALHPYISGNRGRVAMFLAAGVLLLLISDTTRSILIFKLYSDMGNTYLYNNLGEFIIMVFYFGGQFCVVQSIGEPGESSV